ncbi:MAG: DUF1294 domain-containing protein [Eubacteriales bacterium]
MSVLTFIASYIILINATSFFMMGFDKKKARNHQWRIPESTLMIIALIGGSVGALVGMFFFHHKTKKTKFIVGLPFILMLHIGLVIIFLRILPFEYYMI